ncbi:MAG: hypothetical protein HN904_16265 [Victivallales bacterium]|nr:hypothetical protein [Victivallales bacterium]
MAKRTKNMRYALLAICGLILTAPQTRSQVANPEPFEQVHDFEDGKDPFRFWTSHGKPYEVAFKGVTQEQAHGGTRSLKLDVTFKEDGRFLWHIPLAAPIPADGKLTFSGHLLLGKETTGTASLGVSFALPPTKHTGCTSWGTLCQSTGGQWKQYEQDLVARGRDRVRTVVRRFNWGLKPEHVSASLEAIILDVRGKIGQRVVLYADDLKIEGQPPTAAEHAAAVKARWEKAAEAFEAKVSSWETALREGQAGLADGQGLTPDAERGRQDMRARVQQMTVRVADLRKRGEIRRPEQVEIDAFLRILAAVPNGLKAVSAARQAGHKAVVYIVPPVASVMILPHDPFVSGVYTPEIRVTAARGEYEPASFVVAALEDLNELRVTMGDLRGDQGVIAAANLDMKLVKCWWQAGTAWVGVRQDKSRRILTPELLLNDDSLVKVDYEKQENHLKLGFPDGDRYLWISDPTTVRKGGSKSVAKFPVKDSPRLLPVTVPAGTNQQFWLTIRVPSDAKPGSYTGDIVLRTPQAVVAKMALTVRVLPFDLLPPYYTSSMDYHGKPGPGAGTISSWGKSWPQFRAELTNMVAHGLRNCQHYGIAKEILPKVLRIRQKVGMDNETLYLKGTVRIGTAGGGLHGQAKADPKALAKLKEEVREVLDLVRPFGTKTVYFYGIDERRGEELTAQRAAWQAVREAGGRVFTAGWADNIELVGDIQDLHVRAGMPSREEAARWHAYGNKVFCYANPQTGVENPVVYRRNYGFLLWINDYDGASTNAYQHTFGVTWNDFDHITYRAHTIAYPTVDGVVDTIAWEGYREAVDDVRYLTTLLHAIKTARPDRQAAARSAAAYLEQLRTRDGTETTREGEELTAIRATIVNHILAITAAP